MSHLEHEIQAHNLVEQANLLRDQILEDYGVSDFDQLPAEGVSEFDLIMAAAGWRSKIVKSEGSDE